MAYEVLARKWRPQRFDDVVGQDHVTVTLTNAIRTGRLAHAFLFSGPRGVGKTTAARILAKCLNCETAKDGPVVDPCGVCDSCREIAQGRSLDVLEIDGASNRGIDEIRDLRENVRYAPAGGRAKVYIIDEVHMLTKEAFNALLKTLEEPPPGVYFVFATTEVHRVPATIRSRCQKYDFRRISAAIIAETLSRLAKSEKIDVEPEALAELARLADGGLRDAESLLDQAAAVAGGTVTLAVLRELLGEASNDAYLAVVEAALAGDAGTAFTRLQAMLDQGMDPTRIALDLTQALRDLLVVQSAPDDAERLGIRVDEIGAYRTVASRVSASRLTAFLTVASRTVSDLRRSARPRLALEVALARLCRLADPEDIASLVERIDRLQAELGGDGGGNPARPAPRAPLEPPAPAREPNVPEPPAGEEAPPIGEDDAPPGPSRSVRAADAPPEPARVTAVPAAASASSASSSVWTDLIARIRGRKMMLASFLEHGALSSVEDDTVTAVFENTYYEGMVGRRDNLAIIHEELAMMLGKSTAFRVKLGQLPAGAARATAAHEDDGTPPSQPKDLLKENPGLNRIIRELGGQLMPGGNAMGGGS